MNEKKTKLKQIEMMPLPHGGKREGAGRKPIASEIKKPETVIVRIDKRLEKIVNVMKEKLKSGTLDEKEIESLLIRT